jgi:DNA repair exonuclease SbcCD ATPase subunit
MKIVRLEAANVKRLRAVEIVPPEGEPLVVVRGNNGQGKTSVLDSIRFAFGGKSTHPPRVVRDGAREAHVEIETEEIVVLRRWSADDNTTELEVRSKDGTKLKSPQSVLDKLYASTAFDPVEFIRLKPVEQGEILRKLVGIDTTPLDRDRSRVFEERTLINRQLASAEARLKALPDKKPVDPIDLKELLSEQSRLSAALAKAKQAKIERDAALRRVADCQDHVRVAEQALAQAKQRLDHAHKLAADADNAADDTDDAATGAADRLMVLETLLQAAQANAAQQAQWTERQRVAAEVGDLQSQSESMTVNINALDARKKAMIDGAKFPVDGLGFGDGGVSFNGLPIEQASQAEQLRVSVAIATARNPKLRVMLVREGSLLDNKSMALLAELCRKFDVQCWVEAVGEDGPASVVIVDGEVRP